MSGEENIIILENHAVVHKLLRMAYEIWEKYVEEKDIFICGIEGSGEIIAELLVHKLKEITDKNIVYSVVKMDKSNPLETVVFSEEIPRNKAVILVDDVANTGRVLFYTLGELVKLKPRRVDIAVLVNRMHKSYPVQATFIGQNVSTTLQEHIFVDYNKKKEFLVYLK